MQMFRTDAGVLERSPVVLCKGTYVVDLICFNIRGVTMKKPTKATIVQRTAHQNTQTSQHYVLKTVSHRAGFWAILSFVCTSGVLKCSPPGCNDFVYKMGRTL